MSINKNLFKLFTAGALGSFLIFYLISLSSIVTIYSFSYYSFPIFLLLIFFVLFQASNSLTLRPRSFFFIILFLFLRLISLFFNERSIDDIFIFSGIIFLFSIYSLIFLINNFYEDEKVILYIEVLFTLILFFAFINLGLSNKLVFFDQASRPWPLGIHPQFWAEICIVLFFINISNLSRPLMIKFFIALFIFLFILLVQSRAALISVFFLSIIFLWKKNFLFCVILLLLLISSYSFLIDQIFLINDHFRGFESGISGRVPVLVDSLKEINAFSFFFGNGYKSNLDIHNGFFRLFIEEGFFVFLFFFVSIMRFFFNDNKPLSTKYFFFAVIIYCMFSPRLIGFNLLSIYSTFLFFKDSDA
jgi:hypothetical protein